MKHTPFTRATEITAGLPRKLGSGFESVDSLMLCSDVLQAIFELAARAANKESDSAAYLLSVTHHAVSELRAMVEEMPEVLGDALRKSPQFPLLTSLNPENEKANREFLKHHRIGEEAEISAHSGARWTRSDPATVWANDVIQTLRSNQSKIQILEKIPEEHKNLILEHPVPKWVTECSALPPLSKDTAEQWWKIGKQALLERFPAPEKIPELRALATTKRTEGKKRSQILFLIGRGIRSMASK